MSRILPGHNVLVCRENDGWTQYNLSLVRQNEVDVILLSAKTSLFATNIVRLYTRKLADIALK